MTLVADPRTLPSYDPVGRILDAFAAAPDRLVIRDEDGPVSAGDAAAAIDRTMKELESAGVRPGDVVACIGYGCAASLVTRISIGAAGATFLDLPVTMAAADMARYIECAGAAVIFADATDGNVVERIAALRALMPAVQCIPMSAPGDARSRNENASPATGGTPDAPSALAPAELRRELREMDLTSGTSGPPKIVLLRSLLRVGPRASFTTQHLDGKARFLSCGRSSRFLAGALSNGGTVHTFRRFDADAVLRAVADEGITHLLIHPDQLRALVEHPDRSRIDTSSLRWLSCLGAPASAQLLHDAVSAFGPIVRVSYGQTEAALITALLPEDYWPGSLRRLGTCGRPRGDIEIAIGDPDHPLPPGGRGPIWVRTPTAMIGYVDRPELTGQVLCDGWVRTGDSGVQDAEGYLTVLGRSEEAIDLPGRTVFPREIEECLEQHPDVYRAAAFAIPDADGARGSLHVAVVQQDQGTQAGPAALGEWLALHLGAEGSPCRIRFIDQIPVNHGYSTDYAALRHWFTEGADGEAAIQAEAAYSVPRLGTTANRSGA